MPGILSAFLVISLVSVSVLIGFLISVSFYRGTSGSLTGISWLVQDAPALDTFLMYVLGAVLTVFEIVFFYARVSKHLIMSLMIVFLASMLMLVFFNTFKEPGNPPVNLTFA